MRDIIEMGANMEEQQRLTDLANEFMDREVGFDSYDSIEHEEARARLVDILGRAAKD